MYFDSPLNVVLAEDEEPIRQGFEELLKQHAGIRLFGTVDDGRKLWSLLQRTAEDIDLVVVDLTLPYLDALEVLQLSQKVSIEPPVFIVLTAIHSRSVIERLVSSGAMVCLFKPVRIAFVAALLPLVIRATGKRRARIWHAVRERVAAELHAFGLSSDLLGFEYLCDAITAVVLRPQLASSLTYSLYPLLAQKWATTPGNAERVIRHAIETGCTRGNLSYIESSLSHLVDKDRGKPTNAAFIAEMALKVKWLSAREGA